jgi:transcriptional regulator with XRE-family HTH domain
MQLAASPPIATPVGDLLRAWRSKRRLSQLEVGLVAGVSARHLSFVETGRAKPSPELLMAVADVLQVPLRERNALLLAAGYAPRYSQTSWGAPDMAHVTHGVERLLAAHDPYPGVALDRGWNIVASNAAARRMLSVLPDELLAPAPNIFRIGLHPRGLAAHTGNFEEWGRYSLSQLEGLADEALDGGLDELLAEVRGYATVQALQPEPKTPAAPSLLLPFVLTLGGRTLSFFTTLARLGTPRDVTLSELTVELFYPADAATEAALRSQRGVT